MDTMLFSVSPQMIGVCFSIMNVKFDWYKERERKWSSEERSTLAISRRCYQEKKEIEQAPPLLLPLKLLSCFSVFTGNKLREGWETGWGVTMRTGAQKQKREPNVSFCSDSEVKKDNKQHTEK